MISQPKHGAGLSTFLHDAAQFVARIDSVINEYPLQIYASGLVYAPEGSIVRAAFRECIPDWITQLPRTPRDWDASLRVIETRVDYTSEICFLPDGRSLQIGSEDEDIQVWDTMTGKQTDSIKSDGECLMRFSLDGKCSLSTNQDGSVLFWGALAGCSQYPSEEAVQDLALSSDGKVAACLLPNDTVLVLDHRNGLVRWRLPREDRDLPMITNIALSPDGQLLAVADESNIQLWDLSEEKPLEFQVDHPAYYVCFSPDSRLIAYAQESSAMLHDARTGKVLQELGPCNTEISAIAFAPDGQHLALASNTTMHLWHIATGKEANRFQYPHTSFEDLAFSPDGGLLAASSAWDNIILLWRLTVKHDTDAFKEYNDGSICLLELSRDRKQVASVSGDNSVQIWHVDTGQSIRRVDHPPPERIIGVLFSQAQEGLAKSLSYLRCDSTSASCIGIDPISGEEFDVDNLHVQVDRAHLAPDGNTFVLQCPREVKIWDPFSRQILQNFNTERMKPVVVGFSQDSKMLVLMTGEHDIVIWDLASGCIKQALQIKHRSRDVRSGAALSLDGSILAVASWSSKVTFWDTDTGACLITVHTDGPLCSISLDTTRLRLVTERGGIKLPPLHSRDSDEEVPFPGFEGYGTTENFEWITWKSRPLMWLPRNYRPSKSFPPGRASLCVGSTVILGTLSGSVSIIKFAETPPWECRERPGSQGSSG